MSIALGAIVEGIVGVEIVRLPTSRVRVRMRAKMTGSNYTQVEIVGNCPLIEVKKFKKLGLSS